MPSASCRARSSDCCSPGLRLGQIVRPLDTVAAYIPGGPLSPALHADHDGGSGAGGGRAEHLRGLARAPWMRSSARRHLLGVEQVFEMGGAQAIAAFAYGTRTVPKADRIVGPGQHLRGGGEEAARRRSGHRFRRRAHRDPHHRGRRRPAPPRGRHARAGRARCGRLGRFCSPPRKRLATAVAQEVDAAIADAARPRRWRANPSRSNSAPSYRTRSLDEAVEFANASRRST